MEREDGVDNGSTAATAAEDESGQEEGEEEAVEIDNGRDRPEPDEEFPSRDDLNMDFSDIPGAALDFMDGEMTAPKILRLICYLQFKLLEELVSLRRAIDQSGLASAARVSDGSIPIDAHPDGADAGRGRNAQPAADRSRTLDWGCNVIVATWHACFLFNK